MTSPFQVQPGTVFITGPLKTISGMPNPEIDEAEAEITKLGYPVINPNRVDTCKDPKKRLAFMIMCDWVVTVKDWDLHDESASEVRVARIIGKPVTLIDVFKIKKSA